MFDGEKERIQQWGRGIRREIPLTYAAADHALDDRFRSFVDHLADWAPCIRVKRDGDAEVERPTLLVRPHVAWQALPLDRELEPFLTALADESALEAAVPLAVREHAARIDTPALIKVYVLPLCPHCPGVVTLLMGLAAINERIWVQVIDGQLFPDAAAQDRISAAPTVILDDRFRWVGTIDPMELTSVMRDRDPAGLSPDALRGLIEEGDAGGVARMMIDANSLFPAFIELLCHPRWSVRLGAMVAFETLAEENQQLAARVVNPLVDRFDAAADPVKGDLLHVMGESGERSALPFLQGIAAGDHDVEVRLAAQEAVEKLTGDAAL